MTVLLVDEKVFNIKEGWRMNKQPFLTTFKWKNISTWVKSKILSLDDLTILN